MALHVRVRVSAPGGPHVHLRVFVGQSAEGIAPGALLNGALTGTLTVRVEEWRHLQGLGPLLRLIQPAAAACGVTGDVLPE